MSKEDYNLLNILNEEMTMLLATLKKVFFIYFKNILFRFHILEYGRTS